MAFGGIRQSPSSDAAKFFKAPTEWGGEGVGGAKARLRACLLPMKDIFISRHGSSHPIVTHSTL